jgi:hypothetical protein
MPLFRQERQKVDEVNASIYKTRATLLNTKPGTKSINETGEDRIVIVEHHDGRI